MKVVIDIIEDFCYIPLSELTTFKQHDKEIPQFHEKEFLNLQITNFIAIIKFALDRDPKIANIGYILFEEAWRQYSRAPDIYSVIIKELLLKPYALIPFFSQDSVPEYPRYLKIDSIQQDIFKSQLITLMSLLDLRVKLFFNEEIDLIKFKFPLASPNELSLIVNEEYNLYSLGISVDQCKMANDKEKKLSQYFYGFNQNYLLFFKPEESFDSMTGNYDGFAKLRFRYAIREAECFVNEKDKRFLTVIVKNEVI